jgi:hypothetical protein
MDFVSIEHLNEDAKAQKSEGCEFALKIRIKPFYAMVRDTTSNQIKSNQIKLNESTDNDENKS